MWVEFWGFALKEIFLKSFLNWLIDDQFPFNFQLAFDLESQIP